MTSLLTFGLGPTWCLDRHLSWELSPPKRCPRIPALNRFSCTEFLGKWVDDSLEKIQAGQLVLWEGKLVEGVPGRREHTGPIENTGRERVIPSWKKLDISKSHHLFLDLGKFLPRKIQPSYHSPNLSGAIFKIQSNPSCSDLEQQSHLNPKESTYLQG